METDFSLPLITSQTSPTSTCGCLTIRILVAHLEYGTHSGCIGRWISLLRWSHVQIAQLLIVLEKPVTLAPAELMGNVSV